MLLELFLEIILSEMRSDDERLDIYGAGFNDAGGSCGNDGAPSPACLRAWFTVLVSFGSLAPGPRLGRSPLLSLAFCSASA